MKLFSQRRGLKPIKDVIQIESMDLDLRNGLWNVVSDYYFKHLHTTHNRDRQRFQQKLNALCKSIWIYYFKIPYDSTPSYPEDIYKYIREYFFGCEWFEVFDFMEFITNNFSAPFPYEDTNSKFMDLCNYFLKTELSAYRFIEGTITQITEEEEIAEIEEALTEVKENPVRLHLKTALKFLSDRKSPDYRNSIKESISAVESLCCSIANKPKAALGDALKIIDENIGLHGALKKAFRSLYGYTSNEDGIRHALMDMPNLDFEDAKFMLVACSTFINFLLVKVSKAEIKT